MIKDFLAKKGIGFYLAAAAVVCMLVSMICLISTGASDGDLTGGMVLLMVIGILGGLVTLWKDFWGIGLVVCVVCSGAGVMMLVVSRLNMIGLILNNVVEETIAGGFIAAIVFLVLGMILCTVAGFLGVEKDSKKDKAEAGA